MVNQQAEAAQPGGGHRRGQVDRGAGEVALQKRGPKLGRAIDPLNLVGSDKAGQVVGAGSQGQEEEEEAEQEILDFGFWILAKTEILKIRL